MRIAHIITPDDYKGEAEIVIAAKTDKQKREWREALPGMVGIERLDTAFRIKADLFDVICQMPQLRVLYLETLLPSLEGIERMTGLRELHLAYSPKLTDIAPVGKMVWLQALSIQLPKITDYAALASLVQLRSLAIDRAMDGSQKMDNIHFVKNMRELRSLSLTSMKMRDKNFDALLHLQNLEILDISWKYPAAEFEKQRALPKLKNCPQLASAY